MDKNEFIDYLLSNTEIAVNNITISTQVKELGINSINIVKLIIDIEQYLGIDVGDKLFMTKLDTIEDIYYLFFT